MNNSLVFVSNHASKNDIVQHLFQCDANFLPALSERLDILSYAHKIASLATRFEAWSGKTLTGLLAVYCNDHACKVAFITNVSVLPEWQGQGIASQLLEQCLRYLRMLGFERIDLEVHECNLGAIKLYEKMGFVADNSGRAMSLSLTTIKNNQMNNQRDYNSEIKDTVDHQYAYNFDFDVMHPYMIQSFKPFFKQGSLLELGSFKGDFTQRFLPHFDDISCVEASSAAIEEARQKLPDNVSLVNALFETAVLPKRYDNIVLTHVLEHLDDPILVLKRINNEWLTDSGRLFLVCPNANAPSRQIAVKMGLISHNTSVTPAEASHGHRCTYTLDTLERDAIAAGLKVIHRSGIFFKALANFQWDRLLQTDIISREYLEGCYQLGQHYPDLCASIFLLCERGEKK